MNIVHIYLYHKYNIILIWIIYFHAYYALSEIKIWQFLSLTSYL